MPVNLTCTSLGYGRKPEDPEKTHVDMGERANYTDSAPNRNHFFS